MTKRASTLKIFYNNLGAVSALIGKTEALRIVSVMDSHAGMLKALKLAVHAINRKPNYSVNCEDKNIKCSYDIARVCDLAILKAESEG